MAIQQRKIDMHYEEMSIDELKEAIVENDWQLKFYTDELKRVTNKLKTIEFLKKELSARLEDEIRLNS